MRRAATLSVAQQDKRTLRRRDQGRVDRSGEPVALVARTGLDLDRFGIHYTHAGISLRDSPELPWAAPALFRLRRGRPRMLDPRA
ncbi:MAG: DUF2145 domain-containing protein [Burkholderiaceae bacterium]